MNKLIGYARISTLDQSLNLQTDALKKAGCTEIFEDVISGSKSKREGLDHLLKYVRSGDTVVVWKLDRLGRSLRHLMDLIHFFNEKNIAFKSLQESIDTSTSSGKLFLHIFGALAEFERELIRERTIAGLRAASLRGRKGGRPRLMDDNKIQQAKALHQSQIPIMEICRTLGVSKGTLYRSL
jgi:DNA invertase Pin-like site-specific DNA recombinase